MKILPTGVSLLLLSLSSPSFATTTDTGATYKAYVDNDGDGFFAPPEPGLVGDRLGAFDCDDANPSIFPGATDAPGDALDSDCGGSDGASPSIGLPGSLFETIQDAINAAAPHETVWVGPGSWEALDIVLPANITLASTEGATSTHFLTPQSETGFLVLDLGDEEAKLVGLSLAGAGEAITISDSALRIRGCVFTNNGKGMTARNSTLTLEGAQFKGNNSAMILYSSETRLNNVQILDGYTVREGAGVVVSGGSLEANHVEFLNNRVDVGQVSGQYHYEGAGLLAYDAELNIHHSRFLRNSASSGAAMFVERGTLNADHLTIAGNLVHGYSVYWSYGVLYGSLGAGITTKYVTDFQLSNSVFSENIGADVYVLGENLPTLSYNDFFNQSPRSSLYPQSLSAQSTNLRTDPLLVETDWLHSNIDVHFLGASDAVNGGDPNADPNLDGSQNDMGCYGGSEGARWDLDRDGLPDYPWSVTENGAPPAWADVTQWDCDDHDANIGSCW